MPWQVFKPQKPRKPKTTYGWRQIPTRTFSDPRAGWRQVSKPYKPPAVGVTGGAGTSASSSSSSSSSSGGYDPYPSFYDPYSGMLAQLASQFASQRGQLKGDLSGREKAIQDLYAAQNPLVDANYNQAIKESAAVNDAVANRLSAEGSKTQSDLLGKLAMINAPQGAADQAANDVKSYYSGLGGANYAMDSGDVQRLIGNLAETKTYLSKQPGIVAQQLESEYAQAISDLTSQFNQQSLDVQGQRGQAQSDYAMSKFQYDTGQKQAAADKQSASIQDAENRYWDNYWKRRDEALKRYELGVATSNKKQQLQAQKDMKNLDRQKDLDIANIRSGTSITTANIRATQSDINSQRSAAAKAAGTTAKPPSASTQRQAYKAAYGAVVNTNTGRVKYLAHYGDARVIKEINTSLKIAGIDPNSSMGKTIRNKVLSDINGRLIETAGNPKYKGAKYNRP